MTTGDIRQCEEETNHARVPGRNECRCGYRGYSCANCGEREYHASTCPHYKAKESEQQADSGNAAQNLGVPRIEPKATPELGADAAQRAQDLVSSWLLESSAFHVGLSDGNTEPDYNDLVIRITAALTQATSGLPAGGCYAEGDEGAMYCGDPETRHHTPEFVWRYAACSEQKKTAHLVYCMKNDHLIHHAFVAASPITQDFGSASGLAQNVPDESSVQHLPVPMSTDQADTIEAEMRRLENDPTVDKHALRLFMQSPMPCGHAVGNLLTCPDPPFGCAVCLPDESSGQHEFIYNQSPFRESPCAVKGCVEGPYANIHQVESSISSVSGSELYGVGGELYTFVHAMRMQLLNSPSQPGMSQRAQELLDKIAANDDAVATISKRVTEEARAEVVSNAARDAVCKELAQSLKYPRFVDTAGLLEKIADDLDRNLRNAAMQMRAALTTYNKLAEGKE